MPSEVPDHDQDALDAVEQMRHADVFLYNASIMPPRDREVIDLCIGRKRRKNILLILVTNGGSPNVAYRIANCFQEKYEEFYLYVSGRCKSAGTLVALGANSMIFSDHGELGPLDMQMPRKNDLIKMQSGHTIISTLKAIKDEAYWLFQDAFFNIQSMGGGAIMADAAGKMANDLTIGLLSNLYSQIDPLHIGEAGRALSIAWAYGSLLRDASENWDGQSLDRLISYYPSHEFVIDRREATQIFHKVHPPETVEITLAQSLGDIAREPVGRENERVLFLSKEPTEEQQEESTSTFNKEITQCRET